MKNIFNFTEPAYHLRSNNWLERHNTKSPNSSNSKNLEPFPGRKRRN